jgi:hypothetical protein
VDVIGIDAYYDVDGPDLGSKVRAWQKHIAVGQSLHQQYKKPVAFTEIGYCSGHCKRTHTPSSADYASHAEHYQAVFEAFRNVTYSYTHGDSGGGDASGWFLGSFWWNVRAPMHNSRCVPAAILRLLCLGDHSSGDFNLINLTSVVRSVEHGRPQTARDHRRLPNAAVEASGSHSTEVLPGDYTAARAPGRRRAMHGGRGLHVLSVGRGQEIKCAARLWLLLLARTERD